MIKFLGKRVMMSAAVLSVVFYVATREAFVSAGILAGAAVAVYKIRLFERLFAFLITPGRLSRFKIILNIIPQALNFLLLLVSIMLDIRLFAGVAAGLLLLPAVVCAMAAAGVLWPAASRGSDIYMRR